MVPPTKETHRNIIPYPLICRDLVECFEVSCGSTNNSDIANNDTKKYARPVDMLTKIYHRFEEGIIKAFIKRFRTKFVKLLTQK